MSLKQLAVQWWGKLQHRRAARAQARIAHRLYRQGDYAQSAAAYERALAQRPGDLLVMFNCALALYNCGRRTEARDFWQRVLSGAEGSNEYLAEQARIMLRQFG